MKTKPYHKNDGLDQFREIVKKSSTIAEACWNIRQVTDISKETSDKFFELYGVNGSRSPEKAVTKMRDEIFNNNN